MESVALAKAARYGRIDSNSLAVVLITSGLYERIGKK
jgi:hypothetical protein